MPVPHPTCRMVVALQDKPVGRSCNTGNDLLPRQLTPEIFQYKRQRVCLRPLLFSALFLHTPLSHWSLVAVGITTSALPSRHGATVRDRALRCCSPRARHQRARSSNEGLPQTSQIRRPLQRACISERQTSRYAAQELPRKLAASC